MKNILHTTTCLSVAVLAATIASATIGGLVASPLLLTIPFATFITGLVLSTFRADYTPSRRRYEPNSVKPLLLPADDVFDMTAATPVSNETPVSWTARHRRTRRSIARV